MAHIQIEEVKTRKQQGQAFSMVRGKCMQVLLEKMKYDPDWEKASTH